MSIHYNNHVFYLFTSCSLFQDGEQKKSASLEEQYQKQVQEVRFQYEEKLTNLHEEMVKKTKQLIHVMIL